MPDSQPDLDTSPSRKWSVDYRIPVVWLVSLLGLCACQIGVGAYYVASMDNNIHTLLATSAAATSLLALHTSEISTNTDNISTLSSQVNNIAGLINDKSLRRDSQISALQDKSAGLATSEASTAASLADLTTNVNRILDLTLSAQKDKK